MPLASRMSQSRDLCNAPPSPLHGTASSASTAVLKDASPADFMAWESPSYERFANMMMKSGKKATSRKILWKTLQNLRAGGHNPMEVFEGALENVRPMMEVRSYRSGLVPFPLSPKRAEGQAMKWIIKSCRKRNGTPMDVLLARELLAAHQFKGVAFAKREEIHKTAMANQAAAHFRWRIGASRAPGGVDMDRKQYRPQGRRVIKRLQGILSPTPPPRRPMVLDSAADESQ